MGWPQISLLMVVYNRASLIRESIESLLGQSFGDFEIIVVDDGSDDGTVEVVRRLKDDRIRVVARLAQNTGRDHGIGRVRNMALTASRGLLVGAADSDDLRYPENLETLVRVFDRHSDVVLAGGLNDDIDIDTRPLTSPRDVTTWRRTLTDLSPNQLQHLIRTSEGRRRSPFSPASVLMRRSALMSIGGYAEDRRYEVDSDVYRRLAACGRVELIPASLSAVRVHKERLSTWKQLEGWQPPTMAAPS